MTLLSVIDADAEQPGNTSRRPKRAVPAIFASGGGGGGGSDDVSKQRIEVECCYSLSNLHRRRCAVLCSAVRRRVECVRLVGIGGIVRDSELKIAAVPLSIDQQ